MNRLNKISHDDYLRIEGAKMMARAMADFVASTRTSNGSGAISPNTVGVEGDKEHPFCFIKGVTTDMLLDAFVRLTANTFDCHSFIYGDFPDRIHLEVEETKKRQKPVKITFSYRQ